MNKHLPMKKTKARRRKAMETKPTILIEVAVTVIVIIKEAAVKAATNAENIMEVVETVEEMIEIINMPKTDQVQMMIVLFMEGIYGVNVTRTPEATTIILQEEAEETDKGVATPLVEITAEEAAEELAAIITTMEMLAMNITTWMVRSNKIMAKEPTITTAKEPTTTTAEAPITSTMLSTIISI
jgi:hypothetical protein